MAAKAMVPVEASPCINRFRGHGPPCQTRFFRGEPSTCRNRRREMHRRRPARWRMDALLRELEGRDARRPSVRCAYIFPIGIAIGRSGDAVPPRNLSGEPMKRNSYTWSFARSSSHIASSSDTPFSTSR